MNSLSESVKNYLVVINKPDYCLELYKLCLEKVQNGFVVLIITSNVYDFSNLVLRMKISKDQLTKLIIMSYKQIDEITHKLLQLHNWSLLPTMVVVDLSQLLSSQQIANSASVTVMQKVTLCTVSLLTYLQSIAYQLEKSAHETERSKNVNGLLIVKSEEDYFDLNNIQVLKNLYFYKSELHNGFAELESLLQR